MPAGRPKKEIDWVEFEKLCYFQCTLREISGWYECSEDTIERRCEEQYGMKFADVYAQKRQGGKISLRRRQFQMAEKHPVMAIWLGKQYLEQSDKHEQKLEAVVSGDITYKSKWGSKEEA